MAGPCVVEAAVDQQVVLPTGDAVEREEFHAWLWAQAPGLIGIDEGTVTAAAAAAHGIVPDSTVIDAAAAPGHRDWVAQVAGADVEWWFSDAAAADAAMALVAHTRGCRILGVRGVTPADRDDAWRASFAPISVAGFGVVKPAWDEGVAGVDADGESTIFVEPGLGFGTGLHETTQLCLAAIADRHRQAGRLGRVLDHGSGSGILAIAAAVLGALRVDAIEIDERVHEAMSANARRNGVEKRLQIAAALGPDSGPYDLVVANIVADVLIEQAAAVCGRVRSPGGSVVLSGLFAADVPRVAECYSRLLGCRPEVRQRDEWHCLSFTSVGT